MKIHMDLHSQLALALSLVVLACANKEYENKLTRLWSLSRSEGARTAVLNVTSASITIDPTSTSAQPDRIPRKVAPHNHPYDYKRYAFKPRAVPLKRTEPEERSIHYTNGEKSDILLPGSYFPIADVKKEASDDTTFNPLAGGPFQPTIIPLLRSQEFQRRSLDADEEPIIEKPYGFTEAAAQRRSWSLLGVEGDERDEDGDDDEFEDDDEEEGIQSKGHKKKPKVKKLTKYMLPLLIAYKLKFFSMIPLMIGGLVLLVGATGMAGFFFALFAAVMGLQKGSY